MKTLLAGIAIAIPLLSAAATSRAADNDVVNTQTQSGDITATQTLDVDTVTDTTTAGTTATGNSVSAQAVSGSIDVQSTQSMQANATATTTLNVTTDSAATTMTTTATGNTSEADTLGGGPLTGNLEQDTSAVTISTENQLNAATAQASGDVSVTSQAIANTQGVAADAGAASVSIVQTSDAQTQADSGATLQYSPGTGTFSSLAISNNVTATGTNGAEQTLTVNQTMTGAMTQATQFLDFGNIQTVTNAATATGNNVTVNNEGDLLDLTTTQDNESYLRAQAETTAYEFGSSAVTAMGVGNSVIAGETGAQINLNNNQINMGGGIEVIANSAGTQGYDISGSATAMANAVTGFACSDCGGKMTINNTQLNGVGVSATTSVSLAPGGSARTVTGVATAVGNSATFYVSKPSS